MTNELPALWLVGAGPQATSDVMDVGERRRARAFTRTEQRARYIAAHSALRSLIAVRLGVAPRQVTLVREPCPVCGAPHGRPAVADGTPHFSLAYSEALCLIALADTPVGVDLELVASPGTAAGLAPELHPWEQLELTALPLDERPQAFTRAWVRKEAYLKGLGTGLARGLRTDYAGTGAVRSRDLPGWTVSDLDVASVAVVKGAEETVERALEGERRTAAVALPSR